MAVVSRPCSALMTVALIAAAHTGLASTAFAQSPTAPAPAPIAVAALPGAPAAITDRAPLATPAIVSEPSQEIVAKDPWAIVLVQTALSEKGCRDIAINGTWDRVTEAATLTALALPQRPERLIVDDNLVRLVRSAPVTNCKSWSWESSPFFEAPARERRSSRAPGASPRTGQSASRNLPGQAAAKSAQPSAKVARAAPPVKSTTVVRVARANVAMSRMSVNVPAF